MPLDSSSPASASASTSISVSVSGLGSSRSTLPSSPEPAHAAGSGSFKAKSSSPTAFNGQRSPSVKQEVMPSMQMQNLPNSFSNPAYPSLPNALHGYPRNRFSPTYPISQQLPPPPPQPQQEIKPFSSIPPPLANTSQPSDHTLDTPPHLSSANGSHSHGGLRSDPPKRLYEVDDLVQVKPSLDELVAGASTRNQLLLQGDPLFADKSRVETAIRVIIDIIRFAPLPSPLPTIHPTLLPLLPTDPSGNLLMTFEKIASLHGLRLQSGTTTKASSKKQLQAGPMPRETLAFVETAVYKSGENGKRVYVCKRCRNREARRRAAKETSRKRLPNSDSDNSSKAPKPHASLVPPSQDFITAENPDQYDPLRVSQIVEEPPWDPDRRDWRHEIVLFNSPPEIKMEDGSCMWLPFRVVCYGKCHGEKVGFRIKFTLRTWDGRIIATSMTKPIRITDDHKTEPKTKTKTDGVGSSQPAISRTRKSRHSTASSRIHSPTPSESESVQSFSEAGAVMQKQTPSVRSSKPYDRPPSQSPAMGTIPMDSYNVNGYHRHPSTTSMQSLRPLPTDDDVALQQSGLPQTSTDFAVQPMTNTISPGSLRGPHYTMTMDMINRLASAAPRAPGSNLTSPVPQMMPLGGHDNLLFTNPMSSPNGLMSTLALDGVPSSHRQPLLFSQDSTDVEMASAITGSLDDIFANSSHTSMSSYDDQGSSYSGYEDRSSAMFSDSGLPPTTDIDQFLDYTGGEHQNVSHPFQPNLGMPIDSSLSNIALPISFDDPRISPHANAAPLSPEAHAQQEAQINDLLAAMAQAPQATITHVIPGDGPMAGGTKIAIAGRQFQPGMVVVFGARPAPTDFVSDSFVQCKLPPSSFPGEVEVIIQGATKLPGSTPNMFKYNDMDKDLMRLALEVRNQYNGSSSDAAYRLAHHVATRSASASDWSDRSTSNSPMSGASPDDAAEVDVEDDVSSNSTGPKSRPGTSDLQSTIIAFLASLDENAPGSLRASGAINHRNEAQQTLLHIATVMGFHRLVRRLIVVGAHLDVKDDNGYTPLAFAALCGRLTCARVLIEAGASYDRATAYGEMPLDLAKFAEHAKVEALLLSAVWSTKTKTEKTEADADAASLAASAISETNSEIDDDNPSSGSEVEVDISQIFSLDRECDHRKLSRRRSRKSKGKQRALSIKSDVERVSQSSARRSSISQGSTPQPTPLLSPSTNNATATADHIDEPPPYAPPINNNDNDSASWMSRTLSGLPLPHPQPPFKLPDAVWDRLPLPSIFAHEKQTQSTSTVTSTEVTAPPHGWVAFPAPSWETLQKMASPEEVRLFTQAMAAAAFNAVVQSGMTTSTLGGTTSTTTTNEIVRRRTRRISVSVYEEEDRQRRSRRRKSVGGGGGGGGGGGSGNGSASANGGQSSSRSQSHQRTSTPPSPSNLIAVKHVKHDRMLYLFWLPILLFVGFWLLVTALPIATGFSILYARQITRAIKQRM